MFCTCYDATDLFYDGVDADDFNIEDDSFSHEFGTASGASVYCEKCTLPVPADVAAVVIEAVLTPFCD